MSSRRATRSAWEADGVDVDLGRFRLAAQEKRLVAAWQLGRGALLPGLDEDWVHDERASLSAQVAAVLDSLADGSSRATCQLRWRGRASFVQRDPLSEQHVQALMLRLVRSGDRGAALNAL